MVGRVADAIEGRRKGARSRRRRGLRGRMRGDEKRIRRALGHDDARWKLTEVGWRRRRARPSGSLTKAPLRLEVLIEKGVGVGEAALAGGRERRDGCAGRESRRIGEGEQVEELRCERGRVGRSRRGGGHEVGW